MFGPLSLHNIMPGWVANIVQGTAILGAGLLAALYAFQEKILYVPVLPGVPNTYDETPLDHGIEYSEDWITSADGTRLQCWFVKAPGGAATPPPVILFFQENAGNMSHRTSFIVALARRMRCAVFVLGYRGYGKSEGTPGQVGFEADALAALQHVQKRADVDTRRIVLFGRSLGGAVALHLAAGREGAIKAAIVENTFTSVGDMVPKVLPFLGPALRPQMPLNWLIRNQWRNAERIAELKSLPLLLIASKRVRAAVL